MTPSPAHLRVVDANTGEVFENGCPECGRLKELLEITHSKLDGAWAENAKLKKDHEQEQLAHPDRERIEALHAFWQAECGHPKADLDFGRDSRFEAYLRGLRLARKVAKKLELDLDAEALCRRAIQGMAYDPFKRQARNGTIEKFDDPTTIFKNAANMGKFVNRAPRAA